jgi:hypothetical protein
MKLNLSLLAAALLVSQFVHAQTTDPAKTTEYSSFVAKKPIRVYPYMGDPSNARSNKDVDTSIHFTFRPGTRFFVINKVESGSAILGYIVQAWNYNDYKDSSKSKFYQNYLTSTLPSVESLRTGKADVITKEKDLKNARAVVVKDSITLIAAQKESKNAQAAVQNAAARLINTDYDINNLQGLISNRSADEKKKINQKLDEFLKKLTALKKNQIKKDSLSGSENITLMNAAVSVPALPGSGLELIRSEYIKAQDAANDLSALLTAKQAELQNHKNEQLLAEQRLKTASVIFNSASAQTLKTEKQDYAKLKKQIGEEAGVPLDATTPYANYNELAYVDSWANGWKFFLPASALLSDFSEGIYPYGFKFTWGFLTIPLKLRFDNKNKSTGAPDGRFNFEQNLNFGVTFGAKQQLVNKRDVAFNYLAGVSVVNVPLRDTLSKTGVSLPAGSAQAISISVGCMFQYDKFQIGLFGGKDFTGSSAGKFAYQGKSWLGIAIGVSLFGEGSTTKDPGSQSQK